MTRSLITTLTLCVMVVTSVAAGAARGQADPVDQMVICSGHGPVMVHIDANGDPTGGPVLCPDGIMTLLSAVGPAVAESAPTPTETHITPAPLPTLSAQGGATEHRARSR